MNTQTAEKLVNEGDGDVRGYPGKTATQVRYAHSPWGKENYACESKRHCKRMARRIVRRAWKQFGVIVTNPSTGYWW